MSQQICLENVKSLDDIKQIVVAWEGEWGRTANRYGVFFGG